MKTSLFKVPPGVVSNVTSRWPDRTQDWSSRVEAELQELCEIYQATPRSVLPARYGFVVAGDTADGGIVMRGSPDPNGQAQAIVATELANLGISPTVHDTIMTDTGTWLILDEVRPGVPFARVEMSSISLESLAAPLQAMLKRPAPTQNMPSISDWLRERLVSESLTDLPPGASSAPARERQKAVKILDALVDNAPAELCHGDVSPMNILLHGHNQWMLIDPRGMSGEVSYDVAVLSLKVTGNRPDAQLATQLARAAGVDQERTQAWMVVASAARV